MSAPRLGIAMDKHGWWRRFAETGRALDLCCEVFEIERSDWLQRARRCEAVIWRPNLDAPYCEEAREKIYFLEHVLGKRVFPNWSTFWHYDNKRAQAYLFETLQVPTPRTFVSYSLSETLAYIDRATFPLVSKGAGGASAEAVHLLRDATAARREAARVFRTPLYTRALRRLGIRLELRRETGRAYVLWQEFVAANPRDLRVTVIGQRDAFAFHRGNRPDDFRASGSGRIEYGLSVSEADIRLCVDLCRQQGFDCMAFDILRNGGTAQIVEMSYTFNDRAVYNCPGHYVVAGDGRLAYQEGHVWPQDVLMGHVAECLKQPGLRGGNEGAEMATSQSQRPAQISEGLIQTGQRPVPQCLCQPQERS